MPRLPRPPEQSSSYSRCEHGNCRRHDDLPTAWPPGYARTRGGPSRCSIYTGDRCDEPISASRQRLDKSRVIGRISQRLPQLVDRRVQTVIEINEGIGGPVLGAKLFASHHFVRPLQQNGEDMKGLFLQLDPHALLAQLPRAHVHLKHSEAQNGARSDFEGHLFYPSLSASLTPPN